jgi:hypothetical protein
MAGMRADRYTKILLTIIAACLIWLSAKDLVLPPAARAQASDSVQRVMIVGWDQTVESEANADGLSALPVRITWPVSYGSTGDDPALTVRGVSTPEPKR